MAMMFMSSPIKFPKKPIFENRPPNNSPAIPPIIRPFIKLPPLKKQASVQKVVDEHLDALNKCDWNRLMAQYPNDVEIHLPDGQVIKGRQKVGDLFAGFCKPRPDGLNGLKFTS